jgi:hypothetical protein
MGEDPRHIQERIEQTREQMGDTVDALASKADVPGRVRGAVAEKKDAALGKVTGARDAVTGGASDASPVPGAAPGWPGRTPSASRSAPWPRGSWPAC